MAIQFSHEVCEERCTVTVIAGGPGAHDIGLGPAEVSAGPAEQIVLAMQPVCSGIINDVY